MVALFALLALYFVLVSWLQRRLKKLHPTAYEAMGSPTLFWNNSMRNGWLFAKFLLGSGWRDLDDPAIAVGRQWIFVVFVLYLVLFFGFFYAVSRFGFPQ